MEGFKMAEKIVQTAGRDALGSFAPQFAHFNDDVLFGENWNNEDIDLKTRSLITVVALMAQGLTQLPEISHHERKSSWRVAEGNGGGSHPYGVLFMKTDSFRCLM